MAKTLLAVDDSVTMRKVLEITFSGEDFRVITAESVQSALGKMGENPGVFIVDTVVGGDDGYALAKELRKRSPGAPIVMLASRYAPYDQARGKDAGADDWADKPFDTQQLIDKIRKVCLAKEAGPQPAAPSAPQVGGIPAGAGGGPYRAPAAPQAPPIPAAAAGVPRGTQPSLGASTPRTGTLIFGDGASSIPPAPLGAPRTAPAAAVAAPAQTQTAASAPQPAPAQPAPAQPSAAIGAAVNGQLAGKLGDLGLTSQQAEAVMSLSREVIERVVWEVVPQLAETMIKEEIQRLMKA